MFSKCSSASCTSISSTSAIVLPLKRTCSVSRLKRCPWQTGQVTHTSARKSISSRFEPFPSHASQRPPGDVEAEAAWLVAARLGFRQLGEQLANVVEDLDVRRRIRARRPADRRLIDRDQLVELVEPFDLLVLAGLSFAAVQIATAGSSTRMSFTSELLPDPETPVTQTSVPSGISTSTFLRLLCSRPRIFSHFLPGPRAGPGFRSSACLTRYCPVRLSRLGGDFFRRAHRHHLATATRRGRGRNR